MAANGAAENNGVFMKCEKLDRLASWVGASVATAFFSSLERCSCIKVSTADSDADEEANDRPLMLTKFPSFASHDASEHPPTTDKLPSSVSLPL